MPVTRLILLLVVLLGLGVFAWQNWSLPLAVVFLGIKSQELPLSLWILMAIAAGALTSGVLQMLNYLSRRSLIARIRQPEGGNSPPSNDSRQSRQTADSTEDNFSDWDDEEDSNAGGGSKEEWDDYEQPSAGTSSPRDVGTQPRNFEVRQEPKSSSQSGSVYSYSYREPSDSGVGKTEAVYDANFRVITPPYRKPVENQNSDDWESKAEDDEDWGFDDDELEEEDKRDRSPRRS